MLAKSSSGGGFGKGIDYYSKDKDTKQASDLRKLIDKHEALFGENAKDMELNMLRIASRNDKLKKPVFRVMLSLQQGENLSESTWKKVAERYCEERGFNLYEYQYAMYLHRDTDCEHIHLIANRQPLEGKTIINDSNDYFQNITICKKLTQEFGLKPMSNNRKSAKTFGKKEAEVGEYIKNMLNYYLKQNPVWDSRVGAVLLKTLESKLQIDKISMRTKFDNKENFVGVSFEYEGVSFRGQEVGYKAKMLEKQLKNIEYNTRKQVTSVSLELAHTAKFSDNFHEFVELLKNVNKFGINENSTIITDSYGYEWNIQQSLFPYAENLRDVYEVNKKKLFNNEISVFLNEQNQSSGLGFGEMTGQKAGGRVRKLDGEDEEEMRKKKRKYYKKR